MVRITVRVVQLCVAALFVAVLAPVVPWHGAARAAANVQQPSNLPNIAVSAVPLAELMPSDGLPQDNFGHAVAIDADRMVVGAPLADSGGRDSGAAYVFDRNATGDWSQTRLVASDGTDLAHFGYSVALAGDLVVIGAERADGVEPVSGAVYVYEPDGAGGWTETKLTVPGLANRWLGFSVAAQPDRIAVGARSSAFIFERDGSDGWTGVNLVGPETISSGEGVSVALAGDRVVVGADREGGTGAALVFAEDGSGGWSSDTLTASDGFSGDRFGHSVAVVEDRVVVGAPGRIPFTTASISGWVYVFVPDGAGGWSEAKLIPSDGDIGDLFGNAVSASGDRIVVGAPSHDANAVNSGAAYLYDADGSGGWSETKLVVADGQADDHMGWATAVSGNRVVVGAHLDNNDSGTDAGTAYLFGPTAEAPGGTFIDDDGNVHAGNIEAIAARGIARGCNPPSNDRYCPGDSVTRGQMASFLARAYSLPPATGDYFPDDGSSVHEDNINRLFEAGIAGGFLDGTYRPSVPVTRAQMASFLARAGGLAPIAGDVFDDVIGVHEGNINAIAAAGITVGCNLEGTLYCPSAPVRRDQMASFLARALGLPPMVPPPRG
ncbi:MAG: S-layer homology domain-containing protein [Acidimicrobiia bacterium]|nr:S-layer homology domain-containing protein [Acidimicrobiia bacterium]